jgi:hypothetical protein
VSAQDRVDSLAARLAGLAYGLASLDYVRFRADPVDDAVAGVVRSATAEGADASAELRAGLDAAGQETLRLFATRRVLQARRASSLAAVYESLDAVALAPRVADVAWDSWVRASLLVARSLGGDLASLQDRFWDIADAEAATRFDVVVDAMDRVDDLSECRIAEVHTTYGVGFLETLLIHDGQHRVAYAGRRFPDRPVAYAPESNLAQLAVEVADGVDATGRASTSPIGHDQLAASLFDLAVSGSYVATTGCLSFLVDAPEAAAPVLVIVAELPPDEDVDDLIESADEVDGQDVVVDGRRLVVLSPQPAFDSDDEEEPAEEDLDELVEIARRALEDPATR